MSWMGNAKEEMSRGGGGNEVGGGGNVQGEMSGGDIDIKARYKRLLTQF